MTSIRFSFLLISFLFFNQANSQQSDSLITLGVRGLCGMCKTRIENAVAAPGISFISWSSKSQQLTVRFDPTRQSRASIAQRVAAVGHDNDLVTANDKVYAALDECCLYRDPEQEVHDGEVAPDLAGIVLREDDKGRFEPLQGATVVWLQSRRGGMTDAEGVFRLNKVKGESRLLISYTGYIADTLRWNEGETMMVVLRPEGSLQEVKVTARQRSAYVRRSDAIRTTVMTSKELYKAACCNLSESFETNPVVDVSYADAISGQRQIQLLGLSTAYTQLTVENMPGPRGLALPMGLAFIPGTWIEQMQLNKGTGSVVNGFESIAGQINVDLKQPGATDRLFANAYVNSMGKTDLNLNLQQRVGKKWNTVLLLHDAFLFNKVDMNNDGYRDLPTGNLFTVANKWQYQADNGWSGQLGFKWLTDSKIGGDVRFEEDSHKGGTEIYGLGNNLQRAEVFGKLGYVFPEKKYQSIGLQVAAFDHNSNSYFGQRKYDATQQNLYANLIYQSIISNTAHKFRTGLSLTADRFRELLDATRYNRNETVAGGFFEYTYDNGKNLSAVAGIRLDHNNLYGWFATPRVHVRYVPVARTAFRLSVGRGQRTANIIADNAGPLVSSRQWQVVNPQGRGAYGLNAEVAWNSGFSVDQSFKLFGRDAGISFDYFYTRFSSQVVADMEQPGQMLFYNLDGLSRANSLQAELNLLPLPNLELRMAYRFFDVKTTYAKGLLEKPFVAKHRGFVNLGWQKGAWSLDYTFNYIGSKRIPFTGTNPAALQLPERSPAYVMMNAQVSYKLKTTHPIDLYLGGENLTNFMQQAAILDAANPFGPYFDGSLIWGPVSGRMFYAGIRFRIP